MTPSLVPRLTLASSLGLDNFSIFADGLPNSTVAFINLYDNIMSSLNEPLEQSLPNIHYLFDRTIHIDNNIQRNRILHPTIHHPLQSQQSVPATTTPNTTAVSTPVPNLRERVPTVKPQR